MNKILYTSLAAFLVGTGVGFLTAKKLLEKKYAQLAEEEIASVKEVFTHKDRKEPIFMAVEKNNEAAQKVNPIGAMTRSSLDDNPYEKAKKNYNLIKPAVKDEKEPDEMPDYDSEDDEDDDQEVDAAGMTEQDHLDLTKVDRTNPYIIDDVEFAEEFDHHDKVSLYYYRLDDTLTEENEEIIDDIESVVGYDALAMLDMQTTVWVRNEPLGIDYEIIALNKSYQETVDGIKREAMMTPRERYEYNQRQKEQHGK